jgi:glycosyltransferase involved in cell wall biosynthesis
VTDNRAAAARKRFEDAGAHARPAPVPAASRAEVARNAPCPCASGRRFKACCGSVVLQVLPAGPEPVRDRLWRALSLQERGQLGDARALYEEVLREEADVPDAVHMLGVILLQTGHYREALRHLWHAAHLFNWHFAAVHHNLGLVLAAELASATSPATCRLWQAYDKMVDGRRSARWDAAPRISVVIPSYNHGEYVESALESVFTQTYRSVEIIVIDDGSSDDSANRILGALRHSPFPWHFRARGNCGAANTINEAVASSSGEFVNVLNSDDRFAAARLTNMVDAIARTGEQWGFSRAALIDREGATIGADASLRAADLSYLTDNVGARDTVGFSFLSGNPSISSGALFFARPLFDRIGGFRDFRYNHDWDFCLRASLVAEPVFVPSAEYDYRVHASNTILESTADAQREADAMFTDFHCRAQTAGATANRFAPVPDIWGDRFYEQTFASGHARIMPTATLRALAGRAMARCASGNE